MKSIIIYNTKEHTQAPGNNDFRPLLKLHIIKVFLEKICFDICFSRMREMMDCGERMVESSLCEEPESERICFQQNLDLFWEFSAVVQS